MDYIKAFVIGGVICALAQILMDKTKLMPGRIMVILVCSGVDLGGRRIIKKKKKKEEGGASENKEKKR